MIIIGHHTCAKNGNPDKIMTDGPFHSEHQDKDPKKHKFLGSGYYFWDNNIGVAHWWGKTHYNKNYYIFEGTIQVRSETFLDLVGNRIQMIWFQEMMDKLSKKFNQTSKWEIGKFIELLKVMASTKEEYEGIFPYRAIRALDYKFTKDSGYKFVEEDESYTRLTPVMMICLLDPKKDLLTSFTLRH